MDDDEDVMGFIETTNPDDLLVFLRAYLGD